MLIHLVLYGLALIFSKDVCGMKLNIGDYSKSTFPIKRAVDGTRGSKYFQVPADDSFDIYDNYDNEPDFSDYRSNIPGEPGLDYPSFTTIPQTKFTCKREYRGYYADEEAGCQLFHVCDGNFVVSSFLCPVGSIFSQKFLTCDWWNKVDCLATRNFHQVNDQIVISQVDDDEILRKAYEMTSLQSRRNGIAVINSEDRLNNDVDRKLLHLNDLQSGGISRYSDYQSSPSITVNEYPKFKYSSRYSSVLDQHDRDIDYYPPPSDDNTDSSIRVETIGSSYGGNNNNGQSNRFESSYAPTVPTITTTTRKYYSPTIPPIIRSTPRSEKHDLEFESSDHLYLAKGKHSSSTVHNATQTPIEGIEIIIPTVTSPPLDNSTPFVVDEPSAVISHKMLSSTIRNDPNTPKIATLLYRESAKDRHNIISSNVSRLTTIFPPATSKIHGNISLMSLNQNNTESPKHADKSVIPNPSIVFLPPFFYYSNAEQHDTVLGVSPEKLIFNLTASDDAAVILPENLRNRTSVLINDETTKDSVDEASSPFQVTVVLKDNERHPNSDLLKKLIAQQDPFPIEEIGDIEIMASENNDNVDNSETTLGIRINGTLESKISNVPTEYFRNQSYYDIVPRPFSLRLPNHGMDTMNYDESATKFPESSTDIGSSSRNFNAVTASSSLSLLENNNASNEESASDHSEKMELLQQLEQTLGQPLYNVQRQVMLSHTNRQRSLDFHDAGFLRRAIQDEDQSKIAGERHAADDVETKVAVETELVPSLGFSLDTEQDRDQYVDAVLRGLFKDINVSDVEAKSISISES